VEPPKILPGEVLISADSAVYQAKIINYCHDNGIAFAIGADLNQVVVSQNGAIYKQDLVSPANYL
jgi:hypothetical protein